MAQVNLTDQYVRALKPHEKRFEISDTQRKGLRLRVEPTGRLSWVYERRIKGGPKRKHGLGTYPEISIKAARDKSLELEVEAINGHDRVAAAALAKVKEKQHADSIVTVKTVIDLHDELHLKNIKSRDQRIYGLREALAQYMDRPIGDLTRAVLQGAVDDKAKTGYLIAANRMKQSLSSFAKFAWLRGYLPHHIGMELQNAVSEQSRDRAPTLEEIHEIWQASYEMGSLWGPCLRLIILTAQRRNEIAHLPWAEVRFNSDCLLLGAARTKNKTPHITHLSEPALMELQALRQSADVSARYVFTTTGRSPVSGFSKMKKRLDGLLRKDFEPWRIHDLRTSFATLMADAGEQEAVVDRVLNHVASTSAPSKTSRIYNRSKLLVQRKNVLDRWGRLVTGKELLADNVVKIA